jgi:hypothetical protein
MMVDIQTLIVGQQLIMLKDVGDAPDGDSPGGCWGHKGDVVFVRKINLTPTNTFPIQVSHENILDRSFGVAPDEVQIPD